MTWKRDIREEQRRIKATLSRAKAAHMSDTKWRRLFCALYESGAPQLRWKFVKDERVFRARCPQPRNLLVHTLGDVLPDPYGPYREIEWIEILTDNPSHLGHRLRRIGQLPLIEIPGGFRIVGYSCQEDARP